MKIKSNSDGSKWIDITRALILFKPNPKIKIVCWRAKGKLKFCNFRFSIHKYKNEEKFSMENMRCYIRLPFFYYEKSNGGWKFGTNNLYLWCHDARKI